MSHSVVLVLERVVWYFCWTPISLTFKVTVKNWMRGSITPNIEDYFLQHYCWWSMDSFRELWVELPAIRLNAILSNFLHINPIIPSNCEENAFLLPVNYREHVFRIGHFLLVLLGSITRYLSAVLEVSAVQIPSTNVEFTLHMAWIKKLRKSQIEVVGLDFLVLNAEDMDISRTRLRLEKVLWLFAMLKFDS